MRGSFRRNTYFLGSCAFFVCYSIIVVPCFAQRKTIALQRFFTSEIERSVAHRDSANHTAWKPFVENRFNMKSVTGFQKDSAKYYYAVAVKLFRDNFIKVEEKDFFLTIDPILEFSYMRDLADTSAYADTVVLWHNTRGVRVEGDIAGVVSFQTTIMENQSYFPRYLKNISDSLEVVPGMGRWKDFHFSGFDYGIAHGLVSVDPWKWMNLQLGHGKNFVGHGYRSLLLSDAAFSYPFIKGTFNIAKEKLQYSAMGAQLQTLERLPLDEVPEALFKKKSASFNYLNWMPTPRLQVGLFEGVIWQHWDSTGVKPFPAMSLVPIIGLNTALNGFDSENNAFGGINLKFKVTDHLSVYGQYAVDDPGQNESGYQVGARYFDLLIKNFDLQVEWNSTEEGMYSSEHTIQGYSHLNQPLGTPAGDCTDEIIVITNYRYRRFISQLKFNSITSECPVPVDGHPENVNFVTHRFVQQWDLQLGFYVNPKTNLQFLVGFTDRLQRPDNAAHHTSAVYIAFRTNLLNRYFDF